ncbi:MAG: rhodanese-like domain-containing protein [Phycisphaerales bacterium]
MTQQPQSENPPNWSFKPELEISVPDAAARFERSEDDFLLLDIREPDELAVASIDGALHIPLGDIHARLSELNADEDTTIAVICHSGRRSLKAALFMQQMGLPGTRSVAGGIDWWSLKIDPTIPRY